MCRAPSQCTPKASLKTQLSTKPLLCCPCLLHCPLNSPQREVLPSHPAQGGKLSAGNAAFGCSKALMDDCRAGAHPGIQPLPCSALLRVFVLCHAGSGSVVLGNPLKVQLCLLGTRCAHLCVGRHLGSCLIAQPSGAVLKCRIQVEMFAHTTLAASESPRYAEVVPA